MKMNSIKDESVILVELSDFHFLSRSLVWYTHMLPNICVLSCSGVNSKCILMHYCWKLNHSRFPIQILILCATRWLKWMNCSVIMTASQFCFHFWYSSIYLLLRKYFHDDNNLCSYLLRAYCVPVRYYYCCATLEMKFKKKRLNSLERFNPGFPVLGGDPRQPLYQATSFLLWLLCYFQ